MYIPGAFFPGIIYLTEPITMDLNELISLQANPSFIDSYSENARLRTRTFESSKDDTGTSKENHSDSLIFHLSALFSIIKYSNYKKPARILRISHIHLRAFQTVPLKPLYYSYESECHKYGYGNSTRRHL